MMDEQEALKFIDKQLEGALSGMLAPAGFASAVHRRLPRANLSWMPELLDGIGYLALLAAALVMVVILVPSDNPNWPWGLASLAVVPVLWFAVRSIRALAR